MFLVGLNFKIYSICMGLKSNLSRSKGLLISGVLSLIILSACGGGGGGGTVIPPVSNETFTISGAVFPVSGSRIDSDVNDPNYAFATNNDFANPQIIPNPVRLGGYVGISGFGVAGSNFETDSNVDVSDFFQVQMMAGQVINLFLANTSSDLDLILYDSARVPISTSSSSIGINESLTVPGNFTGSRDFYVEVKAVAGVSNYALIVDLPMASAALSELQKDFVPGEVIVKFKDKILPTGVSVDSLSMRANTVGMKAVAGAPERSMLMRLGDNKQVAAMKKELGIVQTAQVTDANLQRKIDTIDTMRALSRRADVESARLNYIYQPLAVPDDTLYSSQWHYPLINLPQAWDITKGSSNVIVAVIDSGILHNHPDFVNADSSSKLVPGYDFIQSTAVSRDGDGIDPNPEDPGDLLFVNSSSFHGTHVAGTIAAATDNNLGVAGVGWNTKVMPLRALGEGGGTTYDIEQAVRFAAGLPNDSNTLPAQKADIINLSLGGPPPDPDDLTTPDAYTLARAEGVIIVAAAGNESSNVPLYPASYDDAVISVSAIDIDLQKTFYSNFGIHVDVAAPGGDSSQNVNGDSLPDGVLSMQGSDASLPITYTYGLKIGTSMATPHVAGVAALMKSVYSGLTPDEFQAALQSGSITDDLGAAGRDDFFGHGMLNALKAVLTAQLLNNGGVLPDNPYLVVSPGILDFRVNEVSKVLNLSNNGTGAVPLTITSITDDSGGWLTLPPPGGLGDYVIVANRNGLEDNRTYSATITIDTNANTVSIPVILQTTQVVTTDDAGRLYFLLYPANSGAVLDRFTAVARSGSYSFDFGKHPAGDYYIIAGTDMDNDGFICDAGEACGVYPDTQAFTLSADLLNADFVAGISTDQVTISSLTKSGFKIPVKGIPVKQIEP